MSNITTTLNRIREHGPCCEGWEKLLKGLNKTSADDEPLPYSTILDINGLEDALWCCRAEPQYYSQWRLYAVWCARQVQHLMQDERSIAALDVAERHARGQASEAELAAAREAAREAARDAAEEAARDAAWAAACAAARAARDAARDAAWEAAEEAAWAAAGEAAEEAAWAAACAAARAAQAAEFRRVVDGGSND